MRPKWVQQIENRCRTHGTAFFFKQWGSARTKKPRVELSTVKRLTRCLTTILFHLSLTPRLMRSNRGLTTVALARKSEN